MDYSYLEYQCKTLDPKVSDRGYLLVRLRITKHILKTHFYDGFILSASGRQQLRVVRCV